MTKSRVTKELKGFLLRKIKNHPFKEASTEDLISEVEKINIKELDKTDWKSWSDTVKHALISLRDSENAIGSFAQNVSKPTRKEKERISNWINQNRPNQSKKQQIWYLVEDYIAFPGEIESKDYYEGAVRKVFVNAYERDPEARKKCIDYHGLSCKVCNFNFGEEFGDLGRDFINVHHLKPLSEVGGEYQVDPIRDLLPVCPNCHAMFHRKEPALSIEEVKAARMSTDLLTEDQ
ncbi:MULTISPECIES: HNH endonuclease [Cyanophyceae]|uniref:HNH endonuclease n=1 Tax=Cyanophyceae TaxID=3028117 RepID=UPI001683885B|nr:MULTISPECIES: HNH endonuclease [Cyanophyceae]MBD1916733.1 HNH endonuclease [Phormidium sp. FACHB-77]MBD2029363.1 HNH endonuclease [Phormidium sp. FACHB-322]MBD2051938.1 HNH endonuclease [Leptolyngbya sp. FACHB-60]